MRASIAKGIAVIGIAGIAALSLTAGAATPAAGTDAIGASLQLDGETLGELVLAGVGIVGVGLLVVIGGIAFLVARSRRRRRRAVEQRAQDEQRQVGLEQLKQRADIALVQLDDTVQQSEQELDFAIAQFGADQVAPYRQALARAKGGRQEAFGLQQQLDDAYPDTDEERYDWSNRILQIAEGATAELATHASGFEELRDLANTAPQALESAAADRVALVSRIEAARTILTGLEARYTGASIAPVQQNIDGAERLLAAIDEAVAQGRASDDGRAAVAVHAAEAAIAQAQALLVGVERAQDDLRTSEERLRTLVDETVADVAIARSMPKGDSDLAPVIQLAEEALVAARATPIDVATALPRLQRANDSLERVAGRSRAEADRRDRATSSLEGWLASAKQNVDAAEQYVSTRRLAVGPHARQMLGLAQDDLSQALRMRSSDVAGATAAARRASERAERAMRDADQDVAGYGGGSRNPYYGGDGGNGRFGGGALGGALGGSAVGGIGRSLGGGLGGVGGAVMGGVLGSVLGNILMSSGMQGGDWGASADGGGEFFDGFGGDGGGGFFGGGGDGGGGE